MMADKITVDDAQYALDIVRAICKQVDPGIPGSTQERARAEMIKKELESHLGAENVAVSQGYFPRELSMNKKLGRLELLLVLWAGVALVLSILVTVLLRGSIPIFTLIWLIGPMIVVIRTSDACRVGIVHIPWRSFLITTAINLSLLLVISLAAEPWSHAYRALVKGAIEGTPPDTTFAWLVRFTGISAWAGIFLYSGLVTIFGEELFFRGWVLQSILGRLKNWAILIQAALFTIPQLLAAFLMAPLQGIIYTVIYSFLGVGIIGGWAAARTRSIWPSLVSATIWNLIMIAVVT